MAAQTWQAKQWTRYVVTFNVPPGRTMTDYSVQRMMDLLKPSYFIGQWEAAPETGQVHLQGYLEWSKKRLGSAVVKDCQAWMTGAHVEVAKASAAKNLEYVHKTRTRIGGTEQYSFGAPMQQGKRSDCQEVIDYFRGGGTMVGARDQFPDLYIGQQRGLQAVADSFATRRTEPSELFFLYGPTGTGKTARITGWADPDMLEFDAGRFMQGLQATSKEVCFDDFDSSTMTAKTFLKLIDRYKFTAGVKGATMQFNPEKIFFTSNDSPFEWFDKEPQATREAIHRKIWEFSGKGANIYRFKADGSTHPNPMEGILYDPRQPTMFEYDKAKITDFFGRPGPVALRESAAAAAEVITLDSDDDDAVRPSQDSDAEGGRLMREGHGRSVRGRTGTL